MIADPASMSTTELTAAVNTALTGVYGATTASAYVINNLYDAITATSAV